MRLDTEELGINSIEEVRKLWQRSEQILNILRSQTGTESKPVSNEEITQWFQALQK